VCPSPSPVSVSSSEVLKSFTHAVYITDKKRKPNFPQIKGNSDGIGCKNIFAEGLPNI
jgi:hypothetical protein